MIQNGSKRDQNDPKRLLNKNNKNVKNIWKAYPRRGGDQKSHL